MVFACLGGIVGTGLGYTLRAVSTPSAETRVTFRTQDIVDVIAQQQRDWNSGDIDGFMRGYWRSDSLRFASGGDITTGWQATLDRYKARYPDKSTMGILEFDVQNITGMGFSNALIKGRWELTRDKDKPWGLFTLHMRKIDGEWVIVSDHTSSAN